MAVFEEGCLSVPEIWDDVERPARIKAPNIWTATASGSALKPMACWPPACSMRWIISNGVLFIDHLSRLKRSMAIKKLAKAKKLGDSLIVTLRMAFLGTPDFAVPTLAELIAQGHDIAAVYSQPPRPKGAGMAMETAPVHKFAETRGLDGAHARVAEGRGRATGLRRARSGCRHGGGLRPAFCPRRFWRRPGWAVSIFMARFCRAGAAPLPSSAR